MEGISVLGFILAIFYLITTEFACNGYTHIYNTLQYEQEALVDFKNGLNDSNNRLSSWKGSNYCHWQGITCENGTRAVISIDLHNPYSREDAYKNWSSMELSGEIRPSLIKLKHLKYLDLSSNSFKAIPIPQFFGSLKNLLYLNFSNAGFSGTIPSNLGNLSNLEYLDLSSKYSNDFSVDNIEWMSSLVSLKHLGMDFVDLSLVGSQWVEVLNKLPVLTELHLASCKLFGSIPSPSFVNFTSLAVINISFNGFNSTFPEWLLNVSSLISIDIRYNQLHGWIPLGLGELANLQYLDLSSNYYLKGNISQLLRKSWKKIEVLYLHINELHGTIPSSIGNFCHLKYLDMTSSRLTGSLPEFLNGTENCGSKNPLPNLISFFLSQNQLIGKLPNWLGQLQSLAYLDLSFNSLPGIIPTSFWLGQLQNLASLDLSFNTLQGSIPSFIGNFCNLKYLDLRNNYLNGSLPEIMKGTENCSCKSPLPNLMELHLENSQLMGKLPNWLGELKNLRELHLSSNKLEGPIPASLGTLQHLEVMSLEWNELTGSLPDSIGQLSELYALDVSFNQLSGTLSEQHFWKLSNLKYLDVYPNSFSLNVSPNWVPPFQVIYLYMGSCHLGPAFPTWLQSQKSLRRFDFSNASISGFIPNRFWNLSSTLLQTVVLSDNQLQGQLPNSLKFSYKAVIDLSSNLLDGPIPSSTKGVDTLDLSNNKFSGPIPLSSGESMLGLNSLLLSDNQITGVIPPNIGKFMPDLSYLSLSNNQITGVIPSNMGEFLPSLSFLSISGNRITGTIPGSIGHMIGLRVVDFSRNNLIGSIPSTINNCSNLNVLDLGNNNLSGVIPRSLGQLKSLQSLHLNHNKLAGELPSSFRNLTSLEVLDLSYNKLWGQVPT